MSLEVSYTLKQLGVAYIAASVSEDLHGLLTTERIPKEDEQWEDLKNILVQVKIDLNMTVWR